MQYLIEFERAVYELLGDFPSIPVLWKGMTRLRKISFSLHDQPRLECTPVQFKGQIATTWFGFRARE